MQYICTKRFNRQGISGYVNIPYGSELKKAADEILYFNEKKICMANSFASHEHFSRNDDGKGLKRGKLTCAIIKRLQPQNFESKEKRNEFWQILWNNEIALKYRRKDQASSWLWSDDFYNAPVEDLKYIAELVGVKKGLLKDV